MLGRLTSLEVLRIRLTTGDGTHPWLPLAGSYGPMLLDTLAQEAYRGCEIYLAIEHEGWSEDYTTVGRHLC